MNNKNLTTQSIHLSFIHNINHFQNLFIKTNIKNNINNINHKINLIHLSFFNKLKLPIQLLIKINTYYYFIKIKSFNLIKNIIKNKLNIPTLLTNKNYN